MQRFTIERGPKGLRLYYTDEVYGVERLFLSLKPGTPYEVAAGLPRNLGRAVEGATVVPNEDIAIIR